MAVLVNGNEIVLNGTVGDLYWDDDYFDHTDVILALAQVGRDKDVVVRINSGGGIATEGAAIHAALAAHRGRKTVIVEGVAASSASVIAMAGDEVQMALGAILMIHDPSGFTFGPVSEHEAQIRTLNAIANAMAGIYAAKSGKTVEQARADMVKEIWLGPEEAVAAGYADKALGASGAEPTAFDYRQYRHPPERLVALADSRAWKRSHPNAAPAASTRQQENPMPNDPKAGGNPAPTADATAANEAAIEAAVKKATAAAIPRADAAEIAKLCTGGGVPALAASLLAEGVSVDEAKKRIGAAAEITNVVALARRKDPSIPEDLAATMIAEGKSIDQVRAALLDKLVAAETKTAVASHVAPGSAEKSGVDRAKASMQRQLERAGHAKKEG